MTELSQEHIELRAIIESLLFAHKKPLSLEQLKELLENDSLTLNDLQEHIEAIQKEFSSPSRGIRLVHVADGYQFRTPKSAGAWVRKTLGIKPVKLTPASMEVLAIVAYKQPVTRSEVDAVRGVDSSHLLKTLMERNLIQMDGKTDDVGRPIIYSTTNEFLEFFSLKSIRDLPTLKDLDDLSAFGEDVHRKIKELPDDGTIRKLFEIPGNQGVRSEHVQSEVAESPEPQESPTPDGGETPEDHQSFRDSVPPSS